MKDYSNIKHKAAYKIDIQKSTAFLYSNEELGEKEIKKTMPLTIAQEKKYLGINLNKNGNNFYNENQSILKKNSKKVLENGAPLSMNRSNTVKITVFPKVT